MDGTGKLTVLAASVDKVGRASDAMRAKIGQAGGKLASFRREAQAAAATAAGAWGKLGRTVGGAALGLGAGVTAAAGALGVFLKGAVDTNSTMEQQRISLGATLNAYLKFTDAQGRALTGGRAFTAAMGQGSALFQQYRQDAAKFVGTTQDFISVGTTLANSVFSSSKGLGNAQATAKLRDYTKQVILTASILGEDFPQASMDAVRIMQGQAGADNLMWRNLQGVLPKMVQDAQTFNSLSVGVRDRLLRDAMSKYATPEALEKYSKTWGAASSTLQDFAQNMQATAGAPFFKWITDKVGVLNQKLAKNSDQLNKTATDWGNRFVSGLDKGIAAGQRAISFLDENKASIAAFGQGFERGVVRPFNLAGQAAKKAYDLAKPVLELIDGAGKKGAKAAKSAGPAGLGDLTGTLTGAAFLLGGLGFGNKLLGGLPGKGIGALGKGALTLGKGLLGGKGKGGALADAVSGLTGTGTPVFVTNWPAGMGGLNLPGGKGAAAAAEKTAAKTLTPLWKTPLKELPGRIAQGAKGLGSKLWAPVAGLGKAVAGSVGGIGATLGADVGTLGAGTIAGYGAAALAGGYGIGRLLDTTIGQAAKFNNGQTIDQILTEKFTKNGAMDNWFGRATGLYVPKTDPNALNGKFTHQDAVNGALELISKRAQAHYGTGRPVAPAGTPTLSAAPRATQVIVREPVVKPTPITVKAPVVTVKLPKAAPARAPVVTVKPPEVKPPTVNLPRPPAPKVAIPMTFNLQGIEPETVTAIKRDMDRIAQQVVAARLKEQDQRARARAEGGKTGGFTALGALGG
ncbi:MAG TPA: hypothetical protein VHN99_07885 [Deinococcales bacterium]|nr:hypothetical protein [Deinococcales bacterium]